MKIQTVKGTQDIFGKNAIFYKKIENLFVSTAKKYGYSEIVTPVLEYKKLFVRNQNDSSDIVQKQMYCLNDMAGRELVLRPEGTPGVIRSIVNNNLYDILRVKVYYLSSVFRYERPKKMTYRQFTQFGIENIGTDNIYYDIEVILLGFNILKKLNFKKINLKINSLGDSASQKKYKDMLKKFFSPYIKNMCKDCKNRFLKNPLRILDCKEEEDKKIIKKAPKIIDFLNNESSERFKKTLNILEKIKIPFEIDHTLVRGLDYYNHTVFEYNVNNEEIAIGGGGHYSHLVKEIGGKDLDGTGFAFGVERIFESLKKYNIIPEIKETRITIIPINENNYEKSIIIAEKIRQIKDYEINILFEKQKIKTLFSKAEKINSNFVIIIGDEEVKNNNIVVKNMSTRKETTIHDNEIDNFFNLL